MTDKQIIIDGKQTTKEDFIDNFSIELTNCNIEERKQIGGRYFDIILRKEQECKELKEKINSYICSDNCYRNKKLKQTLVEIKEIAEKNNKTEEELFKIRHSRLTKVSMGALTGRCNLAKEILQKINEVDNGNI